MNELFLYLIKAAIINAVILGFFYFALRKSNKFQLMRITLTLAMILPLLIPLIPYPFDAQPQYSSFPVISITLPGEVNVNAMSGQQLISREDIPSLLYYSISLVLLLGMIISIGSIIQKRLRSKQYLTSQGKVKLEPTVRSPFSFFSWVFLSPGNLSHPQLDMILRHEFCHVREKHSFDRILSGIFRSVLWFSPFAHITARRLSEVHEFQADSKVIGVYDRTDYSDLILSFYLNPGSSMISNNFSLHIKKRIIMINKFNTTRINLSRVLTGLCLSLIFIILTSMVRTGNTNVVDKSLLIQDVTNLTPGDTIPPSPNISSWTVDKDQKGPIGYSGTVIVGLDILPNGKGTNYTIRQSAGDVLDSYALNKMKQIKEWNPATYNDKPVKYSVLYPFNFTEDGEVNVTFLEGGVIVETEKPITFDKNESLTSNDPDTIRKVNQTESKNNSMPDTPPQFPGGDEARIAYLVKNAPYPEDARKEGIEGTVFIQFTVDETGEISGVIILKSVYPSIDRVANTAVTNMPRWIPATKDNKPVSYQMTMPIKFALSDKEKSQVIKESGKQNPPDSYTPDPMIDDKNTDVFTVVEVPPQFPGGDEARMAFLSKEITYPENAIKEGVQGTVYITFVVRPDGSITDAKVLRGIGGGLDEIALNAIKKMPKWVPGKQSGKPVAVQFNVPIKFKLPKPAEGDKK